MKLLTQTKQRYVVDFVSCGVVFMDKDIVHWYLPPAKEQPERKRLLRHLFGSDFLLLS